MQAPAQFTPRYWQLVEQFREQIRLGVLKPGERLPSYAEMRSQFGVSRPTAEKLHSILERDGLIFREAGRGTFVAQPRRQIRTATIGFAGLAQNGHRHPYGLQMLDGMHEVFGRDNTEVLLLRDVSQVRWEKIDGLLICDMRPDLWIPKLPPGMPYVLLLVSAKGASSVTADDRQGAYEATQHLIQMGHRKIAYLTSATDTLSIQRISGYRDALTASGIAFDARWVKRIPSPDNDRRYTGSFAERGYRAMQEWLIDGWRETCCTGLLAQNDDAAVGVIKALQGSGISVPGEVSVVGFDGTPLSEHFSPAITTMEVPLKQISHRGAELLAQLIQQKPENAPAAGVEIVLTPRLIVRESSTSAG